MDNLFLQGGGLISERIESIDWAKTSLGQLQEWPENLKSNLNLCLNSPFPMLICWGPELSMLYNQAYTDFLDDPYYALGKPVKEIWEDIWDTIGPMLEEVKSTGKAILLNNQSFTLVKNGVRQERYFTFSYSPLWDQQKINGVLTVVHETTEMVVSDARAKMEQERIQRIVSQAPAAVCILDGPELVFEQINENYQQLFPGRSLLGNPVFVAIPEIRNTPIEGILLDVYRTGKTFEGRELLVPLSRSEGGPVEDSYFNFIFQARLNLNKEVDGIIVFAYEVTEYFQAREKAEQLALQIEQHAKLFDVMLGSLQDFVYTFDTSGRFTYSNYSLLKLLGITLDEIIGKNFHDLPYPPELATRLQSQIAQVLETGEPVTDDTMFINPSGKAGYYEYMFNPVFDDEGNVVLVAGSTRDISERKRSEEALRVNSEELTSLNNQLLRVNSDLDNFIYTASHDLRSPISNIEGLVLALREHLSKRSLETPLVGNLLDMVMGSIERFHKTIRDLSDITKLQRINEEQAYLVNIEELIEDIKKDLSFLVKEANAQIRFAFSTISHINFSPKNLRSVFYNLISNSLKYKSPDRDPVIVISCSEIEEYVVVKVEDNGLGMDLTSETSIFGMFRRLHNHVEGTGIGLYIVKKIMDNADGKIEVESEVGKGSVFKLYFKKIAGHEEA